MINSFRCSDATIIENTLEQQIFHDVNFAVSLESLICYKSLFFGQLKRLSSISPIEKIIETAGSRPVIVWCTDKNYYVAKYGKPHDLFNELLGASFARIWNIPVPATAYILIKPQHVVTGLSKKPFSIPCHGAYYLEYAKDVNDFLTTWKKPHELNKIINKEDLLKIGLFDIWLSNEDRNHNNPNLLLNPLEEGFQFVAIDHVNLFNSNNLEKGIYQINQFESLITTDYVKMFFRRGPHLSNLVDNLVENFYLYTGKCIRAVPNILKKVPSEWGINLAEKGAFLKQQLGDKHWLDETVYSFRLYLEQTLHE